MMNEKNKTSKKILFPSSSSSSSPMKKIFFSYTFSLAFIHSFIFFQLNISRKKNCQVTVKSNDYHHYIDNICVCLCVYLILTEFSDETNNDDDDNISNIWIFSK